MPVYEKLYHTLEIAIKHVLKCTTIFMHHTVYVKKCNASRKVITTAKHMIQRCDTNNKHIHKKIYENKTLIFKNNFTLRPSLFMFFLLILHFRENVFQYRES